MKNKTDKNHPLQTSSDLKSDAYYFQMKHKTSHNMLKGKKKCMRMRGLSIKGLPANNETHCALSTGFCKDSKEKNMYKGRNTKPLCNGRRA